MFFIKFHAKHSTPCLLFLTISFFATLSHYLYRSAHPSSSTTLSISSTSPPPPPPPPSPPPPSTISTLLTVSILIPDWEVLVVVAPETPTLQFQNYTCVFPNKDNSRAKLAGELPFSGGTAYKCEFPVSNRRSIPFRQPLLVKTEQIKRYNNDVLPLKELLLWNHLVYDSFVTDDDIVLLVKGVNNRQGTNRLPTDFNCVFRDHALTAAKTAVTSSIQEVFRCKRPRLAGSRPMSATLEIRENDRTVGVMPTLVKYVPDKRRTVEFNEGKSLICACTMVYNVGKFLKEWVMYHHNVGVERFILYDNDSDDNLRDVVDGLNRDGFDVRTVYWVWSKAQEAGFSHSALYLSRLCDWVGFFDVDEFVFASKWLKSSHPSKDMLRSLVVKDPVRKVGQVSIRCHEFGPSNRTTHPTDGVTQGYTCRRKVDQRHKSFVKLDALNHSLLNVIHHFKIKEGYKTRQIPPDQSVVNHYKYQAWPEFRAKFRRRVSAYVIDWRKNLNPMSNDRAPGLGFEAVEPPGWPQKFCEVKDEQMKVLTRRWFGLNHSVMAWQTS